MMKNNYKLPKLFAAFILSFHCVGIFAQTLPSGFSVSDIGGWTTPIGTAFNNDGSKMFVWEKAGKVFVSNWNSSTNTYVKQATAVIDISPEVGNWRDHGLLGFALDPNFDVNGLIYLSYVVDRHHLINFGTGSYNANTNTYYAATIGRVTRYQTTTTAGNLVVVPASRTILIGETKTTGIPILYESHGVGSLAFATDGTLLVSTGDAASYDATDYGSEPLSYYAQALTDGIIRANENVGSYRSQILNSHNGKILRIDPATGNGISSNPFYNAGSPRSAESRVWAMGFRNPFKFTFRPNSGSSNPATGDLGELYVSDVGWGDVEELTIIKEAASNAGWPFFEGLNAEANYYPINLDNKDEPNPLFGTGGCTDQFFNFRDLIKQATADNIHTVYNPCNPTVPISSVNDNRFFHRIPSLDWKHNDDSARVAVFSGNNYSINQIGTPSSGVPGIPFRGNSATGGCWYSGTNFPLQYNNTFFIADYGGNWIKNITIDFTDKVQTVSDFATNIGAIVDIKQSPMDGNLYCTDVVTNLIRKIQFGGNQSPHAVPASNVTYGLGPLNVNFTGTQSFDLDGSVASYSWDFGDGSPLSTQTNPSHSFSSGNSLPKKFLVKLTVTDNLGATGTDSLIISINNTPPNVTITSPVNNSTYRVGLDTTYSLNAVVTDAEHTPANLSYVWQTTLRHNNHIHIEPIDTSKVTDAVISRIGCNGDTYSWFVSLTVTDKDGLVGMDSSKIFPQCGALPLKLRTFAVSSQGNTNLLRWTTTEEINLRNFEVERSYDGISFTTIGLVNARNGSVTNAYQYADDNFLDGYIYYRLRMVDIDDKFAYSLIVRVFTGTETDNGITISPNPFSNEFLLGAVFRETGMVTIRIIDSKGAVVKTMKQQVNSGFNGFTIDNLDNISQGVYFLELTEGTEVRKTKLLKKK